MTIIMLSQLCYKWQVKNAIYKLFFQAIIQSDPFGIAYKLVAPQKKNGEEFAKALGQWCNIDTQFKLW